MPDTIGNANPVSSAARRRNERTAAKFYKAGNKLIAEVELAAAYQEASKSVIAAKAGANASPTLDDQINYTNPDSYLNALVSSKEYFRSKFKATHDTNIAKTRFELPTRLRNRW